MKIIIKWFSIFFILISFFVILTADSTTFSQVKTSLEFPKAIYISSTITPSITPTPTAMTIKKTNTPTPEQNSTESPNTAAYSGGESNLLVLVNNYRKSKGLRDINPDPYTCNFAKKRAEEISNNFSHDGFKNYPYLTYSKVTENIAQNPDDSNVVQAWIDSSSHAENLRQDTPFACIQKFNNFYVFEGWHP